ncbi:MAG TPA: tryptophan--tRNA ligase, partial [Candidatus Woesebacteria bacterium]|nr:tryptophan--tRNA ligase [Candidatus Woesebacteria bacterium]
MGEKKRVFSGIRATGRLHLGNYLGAMKGMVDLQDKYDCIFSVVDLHTITSPYQPATLQEDIYQVVLDYLGAGIDPKKAHLMIQSEVPYHVELAYLLGTIFPVSRLEQLPTYKDKKKEQPGYINLGLLYYPVLMAADILLYKAELVPVGKDQEPHLEVSREIARRFNQMFGETFPEPQRYAIVGEIVPSLTGEGKMSKSVAGSAIFLTDSKEEISRKIARVPTDLGKGKEVPKEGGVANLLVMAALFLGKKRREEYEKEYLGKGIKYASLKSELAEAIYQELEPFRQRRHYFEENPEAVATILKEGRDYALPLAKKTMDEVKEKMGL